MHVPSRRGFPMTENNYIPELTTQNMGDIGLPYLSYDGQGETLILVHATGFVSWLWHPIARELSSSYRVIVPHIVDYRESDPEKGGLNWAIIAKDIYDFCRKSGIETPFLVGHSMGATVLTLAVALHGLKAKAMILIEPILLSRAFYRMGMGVEDHPLAARAIKRTNYWQGPSQALEYLKSRPLFKTWDEEVLTLYVRYGMTDGRDGGLRLVCSPQTEAALFMGGVQFDPWPYLSRVSCPVLVVEGERSENHTFVDLQKALSLLPHACHQVVAGAGHLIPMERPGETARIVRDFFRTKT